MHFFPLYDLCEAFALDTNTQEAKNIALHPPTMMELEKGRAQYVEAVMLQNEQIV